MRIGMALVVLVDLIIRGSDLAVHYSDEGMWPREVLVNFGWKNGYWSLFLLNGSAAWALFLFIIQTLLAILLLIGYRTRIATLLLWLLYVSLQNRNLYVLQAGDDLLRMILFWGIFLPWQNAYSLDAKHNRFASSNTLANLGYFLLLASVYFFSAILKTDKDWLADGTAIYYALSLDQMRLPYTGDWLYQYPALMKLLTRCVLIIEFLVPLFILWPQKKGYLRFIAFLLLIVLQAGIGATLYVGLFFIIGSVSALGLLPSSIMDKVDTLLRRKPTEILTVPENRPVLKYITNLFLALVIVICGFINLSSAPWFEYELKEETLVPANALRLDQYWGMFSPYVMRKDGWFVYYGIDSIGRQWDLRLNQDYVDFKKPEHVVSMYTSDRWRKLAENMQGTSVFLRPRYCQYVLQKWNREHPGKKLSSLNLFYMLKENLPDYKSTEPVKTIYCVCIEN